MNRKLALLPTFKVRCFVKIASFHFLGLVRIVISVFFLVWMLEYVYLVLHLFQFDSTKN